MTYSRSSQTPCEIKYIDTEQSFWNVPHITGNWTNATNANPVAENCLFVPLEGNDINNRIGRRCRVLSLNIQGFFNANGQVSQSTADDPCLIRLVLVLDKQANASAISPSQVIQSGTAVNPTIMFPNYTYLTRYEILHDGMYRLYNPTISFKHSTNLIYQSGLATTFQFSFVPNFPFYVHFNNDPGNDHDYRTIVDNSFSLLCCCNNDDLLPTLSYKCRVAFCDE